jgi:hypothetical protein
MIKHTDTPYRIALKIGTASGLLSISYGYLAKVRYGQSFGKCTTMLSWTT